jgi:hypothetical protein
LEDTLKMLPASVREQDWQLLWETQPEQPTQM